MEKMNRPNNHEIKVTFYKLSGKFYSSGKAFVSHYLFEDDYKQDIVNTQDALREGWEGEFFVVTSSNDDADGFHEALFTPCEFDGMRKDD